MLKVNLLNQKQPFKDILKKRCSENMLQIYRRTPMLKCDFNKVAKQLRYVCSTVNLQHIFRTPFPKNTSDALLLKPLQILRKEDCNRVLFSKSCRSTTCNFTKNELIRVCFSVNFTKFSSKYTL